LSVSNGATTGMGWCLFRYNTMTMMITTHCQHNIAVTTAAHIHQAPDAAATSTGNPIITFTNNGMSPIMMTSVALTNDQEASLFNGALYVNVHTTAFPAGQIRGNIMMASVAGTWYAELDNMQAAVTPTTASGGVAMVVGHAGTPNTYDVTVWHTASPNVTQAHIHGPSNGPGNSTGIVVSICGTGKAPYTCQTGTNTPWMFSMTGLVATTTKYSDAQIWGFIKSGNSYVNVHTNAFPGGEVRGQVTQLMMLTKPIRAAASTIHVSVPLLALLALAARLLA